MERTPPGVALRAIAAVAMLAGFYVLGLGIVAGLLATAIVVWLTVPGQESVDIAIALAVTAFALTYPAWQFARTPDEPPGTPIAEADEPELWALVREIAEASQTRPPDEIYLADDVNAGVAEGAGVVGLRRGRRRLVLGVPLLLAIDRQELRAVLGHELGHYAHGHTVFGDIVYRGLRRMAATIERIGRRRLSSGLLSIYAAGYALVALAVLRRMETAADAAAVRVAGRESTERLLRRLPAIATAWDDTVEYYARGVLRHGYRSVQLFEAYQENLRRCGDTPEPGDPPLRMLASHPPIAERIRDLPPDAPSAPAHSDPVPAVALLRRARALSQALSSARFDALVQAGVSRLAEEDSAALELALESLPRLRRGGVGGVLDILHLGRGDELLSALPRSRWRTPAELLEQYLLSSVGTDLVNAGQAHWRHRWGSPVQLVSPSGGAIAVRAAILAVIGTPAARNQLTALGLPDDAVRAWALPGWSALDPAPVDTNGTGDTNPWPLLADRLYVMMFWPAGRCASQPQVRHAALVAALLADLRSRGHVDVAGDGGTVRVLDSGSAGDRLLDSVLARLVDGAERRVEEWLELLGPDVGDAMNDRLQATGRRAQYAASRLRPGRTRLPADQPLAVMYRELRSALRAGEADTPAADLAKLLWGMDLFGQVFGWTAPLSQLWLGGLARRDPLMLAIRVAIGRRTPLVSQPGP